jgi:hypothetical protein
VLSAETIAEYHVWQTHSLLAASWTQIVASRKSLEYTRAALRRSEWAFICSRPKISIRIPWALPFPPINPH